MTKVSQQPGLLCAYLLIGLAISTNNAMGATLPEDARPFTRAELYAYLSEQTQVRSDGGLFYSGAGILYVLRDGESFKGTWSTDDSGSLCWHVIERGTIPCETYYHTGDSVSVVFANVLSDAPSRQSGNTLANLAPGTNLFATAETVKFLTGKTVIWGPGRGLYYAPDATLVKIWNGIRATGRWSVTNEGAVCWHIPGWGVTPCESYYFNGDELMVVNNEIHSKAAEHVEGNRIGTF